MAKRTKRLTRVNRAVSATRRMAKTPFEILEGRLKEVIALKKESKYHDLDFERLVDSL